LDKNYTTSSRRDLYNVTIGAVFGQKFAMLNFSHTKLRNVRIGPQYLVQGGISFAFADLHSVTFDNMADGHIINGDDIPPLQASRVEFRNVRAEHSHFGAIVVNQMIHFSNSIFRNVRLESTWENTKDMEVRNTTFQNFTVDGLGARMARFTEVTIVDSILTSFLSARKIAISRSVFVRSEFPIMYFLESITIDSGTLVLDSRIDSLGFGSRNSPAIIQWTVKNSQIGSWSGYVGGRVYNTTIGSISNFWGSSWGPRFLPNTTFSSCQINAIYPIPRTTSPGMSVEVTPSLSHIYFVNSSIGVVYQEKGLVKTFERALLKSSSATFFVCEILLRNSSIVSSTVRIQRTGDCQSSRPSSVDMSGSFLRNSLITSDYRSLGLSIWKLNRVTMQSSELNVRDVENGIFFNHARIRQSEIRISNVGNASFRAAEIQSGTTVRVGSSRNPNPTLDLSDALLQNTSMNVSPVWMIQKQGLVIRRGSVIRRS